MMDGRVGAIREALDEAGFTNVSIMSYAANMHLPTMVHSVALLIQHRNLGTVNPHQMDPAIA